MDERLPSWLSHLIRRLSFLAIPNLAMVLCGAAALGFAMSIASPATYQRFFFHPEAVMAGEWWRLFTFPFIVGSSNPIFFLFYVLYLYFVTNTLEEYWGSASLTIYVLLGYATAIALAFVTMRPISISYYLMEYLTLAFGTLFPDYTLNLYGLIPVKAKWFAWLSAFLIFFTYLGGTLIDQISIPLAFFPYLLFFGPMLLTRARRFRQTQSNRRRFDKDMWR